MSTNALTVIKNAKNETTAVIYKHWDGYPSSWGVILAEFLDGRQVVNGISSELEKVSNGVECMAASLIAENKEGPGDLYLYTPADENEIGYNYLFIIKVAEDFEVTVEVCDWDGKSLVSFTDMKELKAWCETAE